MSQQLEQEAVIQNLREALLPITKRWEQFFRRRLGQSVLAFPSSSLHRAAQLVSEQYNVVLIVTETECFAVPDFAVSQWLVSHRRPDQLFLVIPVFDVLSNYLAASMRTPIEPAARPSPDVTASSGRPIGKVKCLDNWEFVLKPSPRPPNS
jgi:hypothetical protein